jgi:hypothetical protein
MSLAARSRMKAFRSGPTIGALRSRALDGAAVLAGACALYALSASVERIIDASPIGAALIEEAVKALVVIVLGRLGLGRALRGAMEERGVKRLARTARLGSARGLSRGLAAVALFAAAENVAYFAAAAETGVFARLLWSTPVHLASALAQTIGVVPLLFLAAGRLARSSLASREEGRETAGGPVREPQSDARVEAGTGSGPRRLAAFLAPPAGIAAACAWHAAANAIASGKPGPLLLAAGSAASIAATLALGRAFLAKAYIGGFIHGSQEED